MQGELQFVRESRYARSGELYRDPFLKLGEQVMLAETLACFDEARRLYGGPLVITSGRRSLAHQDELRRAGLRAAQYSPHCHGAALDVYVPDLLTDWALVGLLKLAAENLSLPRPRIGFLAYRSDERTRRVVQRTALGEFVSSTFVHVDFVFLLRGFINDVPESVWRSWREGVTW